MNGEELLKNMDLIDPNMVAEADKIPLKRKKSFLKWCTVAAAAAAIFAAALLIGNPDQGVIIQIGEIERHYKSIPMASAETAPVYPPEYLTEIERYNSMTLGNTVYRTRARTISPELLGKPLGACQLNSYDIYSDSISTLEKPTYVISGISPSELVAVELGGEYCVFMKDTYSPPSDFGAFWDSVNLSSHTELDSFIHYSGQNENNQQSSYRLSDDETLWKMLEACRNAPYLELERFYDANIETVSFSITSEALGVYKHGLQITSDGYIITNLMEWGYVFQIGEKTARNIIQHIMENSEPAIQEPYFYYLYGTFVGIENGYMLVDDTVLCKEEKDGMIFRIPLNDIRISRTLELGYVSVGDVVLVNFTGTVDSVSGDTVSDPVSVQKGILFEGNILIEE